MDRFRAFALVVFVLTVGGIWRPLPLLGDHCAGALLAMAQEQGNPNHQEPPPGWYCQQGEHVQAGHECTCHRECVQNTDENGNPTDFRVAEDIKCRVFCYKDHCSCPIHDCP